MRNPTRPIADAPRDGTRVRLLAEDEPRLFTGYYSHVFRAWLQERGGKKSPLVRHGVTHWEELDAG